MSYENNNNRRVHGYLPITTAIFIGSLTFNLGQWLPDILDAEASLQLRNHEVANELEQIDTDEFSDINRLVLERNFLGSNGSYEFESTDSSGQEVECSGEYLVEKQARLAGSIACTTVTEVVG